MPNGDSSNTEKDDNVAQSTQTLTNGDHKEALEHQNRLSNDAHQDKENSDQINVQHDQSPGPRGTKRKADHSPTSKRPKFPSPPWKKVIVEGPTSFVEDGRRKSSRTNAVPLELQAPSDKRQTRAALNQSQGPKRVFSSGSHSQHVNSSPTHVRSNSATKPGTITSISQVGLNHAQPNGLPHSGHQRRMSFKYNTSYSETSTTPSLQTLQRRKRSISPLLETSDSTIILATQRTPSTSITTAAPGVVKIQRLRLNFRAPPIPVLNPANVVPPKKFASLPEWLAHDNPLDGEDVQRLTTAQARDEAIIIRRLVQAAKPGGVLSEGKWSGQEIDPQPGPCHQYGHPDYLLKHVEDLRIRMGREKKEHMILAKRTADLALLEWRSRQPQSREEVEAERRQRVDSLYKRVLTDLKSAWNVCLAVVKLDKLNEWKEQQQALGKKALNDMLEHSSELMVRRRARLPYDTGEALETGAHASEDDEQEDESSSGSDVDEDSNMSSSDSSDEEDGEDTSDVPDIDLTVEELRRKYAAIQDEHPDDPIPDPAKSANTERIDKPRPPSEDLVVALTPAHDNRVISNESPPGERRPMTKDQVRPETSAAGDEVHSTQQGCFDESDHRNITLDVVADELLDDSDEQSDSDDETDDDEINDNYGNSNHSEDSNSEDEENCGTFALLSSKDQAALSSSVALQSPQSSATGDAEVTVQAPDEEDRMVYNDPNGQNPDDTQPVNLSTNLNVSAESDPQVAHVPLDLISTSDDRSGPMSPNTDSPRKPSEPDTNTSIEPSEQGPPSVEAEKIQPGTVRLQVPSLLRGQLREYQHYGLDWLAGMYANQTNGILADEMGLGKTIQTIALLAHLATDRQIWGPHLIIVPTSVMLNWEMEFKKWCPGFKILTYYGTQEERKAKRKGWMDNDRWHVCITSYQLALQDASSLKRRHWHYMVLDEAHNIKNFRSQRWQTLLGFNSQARLLLTGTPLQNNVTELWSLLFFLAPGQDADGKYHFSDLKTWTTSLNHPVSMILDHGRDSMDEEAKESIKQLHGILRPHLLRRLKADVEKQMPKKYEHIVKCRLSKRQRQLYDGYMGLARTKDSFASGNYLSIINCLMQLRKVCNHPDLFETREIVTSFAMPKSAVADYEIKELFVRKRLLNAAANEFDDLDIKSLWGANISTIDSYRSHRLAALSTLANAAQRQRQRISSQIYDGQSLLSSWSSLELCARQSRQDILQEQCRLTKSRIHKRPVYGTGLMERLIIDLQIPSLINPPRKKCLLADWYLSVPSHLQEMISSLPQRSECMKVTIAKFGCITPNVIAPNIARLALTDNGMRIVQDAKTMLPADAFHEARVRLSIAFPDKSLIQYDCGKLQQLDRLLRQLQVGGHRALIFTQMTKVLDILEQFLNLHGHRYLRLDGATKIEQRQIMTDRFNNDPRIPVFILSSRSGGLGINLIGADTVIFYDLDWNPAMDKQCQDRCHRIGQTRDVHIYRFVSEGTIEANILRKSNQKRMLDDVVIQEGDFTTDYFDRMEINSLVGEEREGAAETDAALDKVLGGSGKQAEQVLELAEDKEDIEAAKTAEKDYVYNDDVDFDEKVGTVTQGTPVSIDSPIPVDKTTPLQLATADSFPTEQVAAFDVPTIYAPVAKVSEEAEEPGSSEEYMRRFLHWELKDVVIVPQSDRARKKAKKGRDHGIRIRR